MKKTLICLVTICCLFGGEAYAQKPLYQMTEQEIDALTEQELTNRVINGWGDMFINLYLGMAYKERAVRSFCRNFEQGSTKWSNSLTNKPKVSHKDLLIFRIFLEQLEPLLRNTGNFPDAAWAFWWAYNGWNRNIEDVLLVKQKLIDRFAANSQWLDVDIHYAELFAELRRKREQQERVQLANALRSKLNDDNYFVASELAVQPFIDLNLQKIADKLGFNENSAVKLDFSCKVSKNHVVEILPPPDYTNYSNYEKALFELIKEQMSEANIEIGYVTLDKERIPVNSIANIRLEKDSVRYTHMIDIYMKKEIRKKQVTWEMTEKARNESEIKGFCYYNRSFDLNRFYTALFDELNQNQELSNLPKGRYKLSIAITSPILSYYVNDKLRNKAYMPYLLNIDYIKYTLMNVIP